MTLSKYLWLFSIVIFFIISLPLDVYTQKQTTYYYDIDWEETTQAKASYYRVTTPPVARDTLFHIQDYFINGSIYKDGYVTTLKYVDNYVGTVTKYYPNGQIESYTTYHPETLKKFGPAAWYLQDGSLLAQGSYEYGSASDGIVRNYTYATPFTKVENNQLISRLNYYENSHQVAHEIFFMPNNFDLREEVFYSKNGQEIGRLKYNKNSNFSPESGTRVRFYFNNNYCTSIKTIQYYEAAKAVGEQISFHQDGSIWTKGINKADKHYDGAFIDGWSHLIVKKGQLLKKIHYKYNWEVKFILTYKNNEIWKGVDESIFEDNYYKEGRLYKTIIFDTARKKTLASIKTYGTALDTINWYHRNGQKLGEGYFKNNKIWSGLHLIQRIDETIFTLYQDGQKNGIQKQVDDQDQFVSEKLYINNDIIHYKTIHPVTNQIITCSYKDGRTYSGRIFDFDTESIFEDGELIETNEYKIKDKQFILYRKSIYDPKSYKTNIKIYPID